MLGAFGAHMLKEHLQDKDLATFEIGVRYQMYHSLAMVLTGMLALRESNRWLHAAGFGFLFGILIFSGCLYALVFSGKTILGAIVPIGGVAFILGWIALAIGASKLRGPERTTCGAD